MDHLAANTSTTWILPGHLKRRLEKHPLGKNLFITTMGLYPENTARELGEIKGANVYTLLYAAHGKGWLETAAKKIAVKTNQYLIIPPETVFRAGPDAEAPWRMYAVQFTGQLADEIYRYLGTGLQPRTTPPLVGRNGDRKLPVITACAMPGPCQDTARLSPPLASFWMASM